MIKYQIWLILHELVNYYILATAGRSLDIQGVNGCETLLAKDAVVNPWSFVFYVISELVLSLWFAVESRRLWWYWTEGY